MKTVDEIMALAQVFASAWSLVGGRFDNGNMLAEAEEAKAELRQMVEAALKEREGEPFAWYDTENGRVVDVEWNKLKPTYEGDWRPLYTAPPKAQPMSLNELHRIILESENVRDAIRRTERHHKIGD